MKKRILILLLIMIITVFQRTNAESINQELLKGAFIESMLHHISAAVNKYGTGRLWYRGNEEILELKRPDPRSITSYSVTIRLTTFEGAHNPPYASETMTFKLPEMRVLNYNVKWLN
jgi:hypothetical protein